MAGEIIVTPSPAVTVGVYSGQPGPQGIQGPAGPAGPTGATGPAGPTQTLGYVHTQNTVSSTWSITHNLGFKPNVTTEDSAGTVIEGSIAYPDVNTVVLTFSTATSGKAYLS